ncbi:hypothetical protein, partial [Morganella morganii]|uniref:hypothetical protein n=1 Tax=Morganella morganii TaxID=582 RepID=UPI003306005F
AFGDGVHDQSQKPLSGDLTLIQIRFPIIKELSPFYLWLRAVDGITIQVLLYQNKSYLCLILW